MLSQSDILRTLANYSCSDEAVTSMALSSECTPTRLLEKLTEAERLDIALDISMKLGLDVTPLWRTWALRCLQNSSFQQAREKFRHCFMRLKLPSGRSSPAQSMLLGDILSTLTKLEDSPLPLAEQVALIKKGVYIYDVQTQESNPVTSKPKIYNECNYYLKEYGNAEDVIEFNVRNLLWDEAVKFMIENASQVNVEKFFLKKILLPVTSRGQLKHLLEAFIRQDHSIALSTKYFKAIYKSCVQSKRYNLLHYIQVLIGDNIAAANTHINFFFFKKPIQSYKEFNQRLTYLKSARKNYQNYLDKLEIGNVEGVQKRGPELFYHLSKDEVRNKLKLLDWQIDITHNFSVNEVPGTLNGVEIDFWSSENKKSENDERPVTLFDEDVRRRTFLTALVLIYFDLSCSSYFSKTGFDLARNLMSVSNNTYVIFTRFGI